MAKHGFIQTLITDYQQHLQFNWIVQRPVQPLPATPLRSHWIGKYTTVQYHPVEIIYRENLREFSRALQQGSFYQETQPASLKPVLIIFSDQSCPEDIVRHLRQYSIPVLHSPLSANKILRELVHAFAECNQHQTRHGVMLSINGHGVLLTGHSGIGKSALALELVSRGHQLVADDTPLLYRLPDAEQIFAVCPPLLADCLEVRGLGILDLIRLFGSRATLPLNQLDLVIELVDSLTLDAELRLQVFSKHTNILGVAVNQLSLPVNYPASLAVIVETVARNHVLYQQGHDAADILAKRQQDALTRQTV